MGLAFARGCAFEGPLYVTDQKEMFSLMQHNIMLNDLGDQVKGAILNWSVTPPSPHLMQDASAGLYDGVHGYAQVF